MSTTTENTNWHINPKQNWGLLVISIWSLINGIGADIKLPPYHPPVTLYLLNLLSGILLLLTWYFASKYSKVRWIIIIVGILSAYNSSSFAISQNMKAEGFISPIDPTTDISLYGKIREKIGDSDLTRHFPLAIPENAENVHLEYLPKFLQGGSHLQLRMKLPISEINELLIKFRSQSKYKFIGGDRSDHADMEGGVPTTYFYTSGIEDLSFPSNYEILVLDSENAGTPDAPWNHGSGYGVIICTEKSEIIYWAEYW